MGQLTTNYLAGNGRRIPIIGQLYINRSVQFWGIPDFVRISVLSFIENLQAPTVVTGWVHANISNQNWLVIPGGPYSIYIFPWVSNSPACSSYIPRSTEKPRSAIRRVRYELFCQSRRERMRSPTTSLNTIVNRRVHHCGDDWEGPVDQ